jgi:hypothetical protein
MQNGPPTLVGYWDGWQGNGLCLILDVTLPCCRFGPWCILGAEPIKCCNVSHNSLWKITMLSMGKSTNFRLGHFE